MALKELDFHLGIADKLLLLLATLGVVGSLYFLTNDQKIYDLVAFKQEKSERLGELSLATNDVRRKFDKSLLWFNVSSDVELYEGDSIFTGQDSSAIVQIDDDLKINLQPNSLVIVSKKDDELVLDLQVGQFIAQSKKTKNKQVTLLQKGRKARFSIGPKGKVKVAKSKKGQLSLSSNNSVFEYSINGNKGQISNKQKVQISEKLEVKKININVDLLLPISSQKVLLNPDQRQVQLKWKSNVKDADFQVLVSKDRDFDSVLFKAKTNKFSTEFTELINAKLLYWKVVASAQNAESNESFIEAFKTVANTAPNVFEPLNEDILLFEADESKLVNFKWQAISGVDFYNLEVSEDPEFNKILASHQVSVANFSMLDLGEGLYYWRVSGGLLPNKKMTLSKVSQFKVEFVKPAEVTVPIAQPSVPVETLPIEPEPITNVAEKVKKKDEAVVESQPLPPPTLEADNRSETLSFSKIANWDIGSIRKAINKPPVFSWTHNSEEALFSKIQFSRTEDFKKVFYEKLLDKLKFRWRSLNSGSFYWRVASLRKADEKVYKYSKPFSINIKLPPPEVLPEYTQVLKFKKLESMNKSHHKVTFDWSRVPLAKNYKIKLNDKSLSEVVKSTKSKVDMDTSKVNYVNVAAATSRGQLLSKYSKKMKINVTKKLLLRQPKLLFPESGVTVVQFGEEADDLMFNWSKVKYADKYRIQIAQDKSFKKILVEKSIDDNSLELIEKLKQEIVYWRVKAFYKKHHSKWSKVRSVEF